MNFHGTKVRMIMDSYVTSLQLRLAIFTHAGFSELLSSGFGGMRSLTAPIPGPSPNWGKGALRKSSLHIMPVIVLKTICVLLIACPACVKLGSHRKRSE
jgi:hypothetical protein